MSFPTLLAALRRHPRTHAAFVFEDHVTSFAELDARSDRVAQALQASGIGPGARVAYIGRNTDVFFELLYGAMKAGVVTVPVNWRLAPPEVAGIVADAQARLVVLGREYAGDPAYAEWPGAQVLAGEAHDAWAAWRDRRTAAPSTHVPAPSDVALQLYTSGTTGQPKGVMLTHANLMSSHLAGAEHDLGWNRWTPDDVALLSMPVSHIAGTGWGLIAMHYGATCHIHRQFDPAATLEAIARHRVTRCSSCRRHCRCWCGIRDATEHGFLTSRRGGLRCQPDALAIVERMHRRARPSTRAVLWHDGNLGHERGIGTIGPHPGSPAPSARRRPRAPLGTATGGYAGRCRMCRPAKWENC